MLREELEKQKEIERRRKGENLYDWISCVIEKPDQYDSLCEKTIQYYCLVDKIKDLDDNHYLGFAGTGLTSECVYVDTWRFIQIMIILIKEKTNKVPSDYLKEFLIIHPPQLLKSVSEVFIKRISDFTTLYESGFTFHTCFKKIGRFACYPENDWFIFLPKSPFPEVPFIGFKISF